MKGRAHGITALTLAFEILAVGSFLLGARGLSGAVPAIPLGTALLLLLTFVVSAIVALGLHGRRWWCRPAARVWCLVAVILFVWAFFGPEHGLPLMAAFPIGLALVGFCWLLESYLPRVLEPSA